MNATHTPVGAGDYTVQTGGTLGGNGTIGPNVNVQDGNLAPGASAGTLTINGNLGFIDSSVLSYELTDNDFTVDGGINDLTSVGGDLTLDGTLNVSVLGNSQLTAAGSYRLFDYAGSLTDNGLSLGTIALATGLAASIDTSTAGQVNLLVSTAALAGDYNGDGKVDAADYVVWRKDPTNPNYGGDPGGYNTWRANFGATSSTGSGLSSNAAVPEPTLVALLAVGSMLLGFQRVPCRNRDS